MGPLSIILFISALPVFYLFARSSFTSPSDDLVSEIFLLDPNILVEDRRTFYVVINLKAAEIALLIAASLLLFSGMHPKEVFKDVEWISIYFIMGLFILVGSIEILGLLDILGELLTPYLELPLIFSLPFISFGMGILSAVVDNIPISAALAPVFFELEATGVIGLNGGP
jgi:Na+/H+ antiporter NhaD/arsenite permease-like protein